MRGFTLEVLANRANTTNQQISHLELGRRRLTVEWLRLLAKALDCTPADLLAIEPPRKIPMKRAARRSTPILRVDTAEVRVTEWRLAPGGTTGRYRHNYDYVVVPLTHGTLRLVAVAGETMLQLSPGAAYFRKAGVEHTVFNAGDKPLAFVDVELKDRPG